MLRQAAKGRPLPCPSSSSYLLASTERTTAPQPYSWPTLLEHRQSTLLLIPRHRALGKLPRLGGPSSLSYVEPPPPIETRCFLDLYILSARQHTQTYTFGRKLGHITIAALEPSPLVYESFELPSTKCEFRITVEGSLSDPQRFRTSSVKLQLMLHIKTPL